MAMKNLNRSQKKEMYRPVFSDSEFGCTMGSAGIVPDKICELNFNCSICSFYKALDESNELGALVQLHIRDCKLDPSLFYHGCHTWAKVEENAHVRIGIDDFGQNLLGNIQDISLPVKGEKLSMESLWLKGRGFRIPLVPPVEGYVVERNLRLLKQPSMLNEYPYDLGWIVVIQPVRLSENLQDLHYGPGAQNWCDAETLRFSCAVADAIGMPWPQVGITLQDGGRPDYQILDAMRPEQRKEILKKFLLSPAKKS